ncbi:phage tail protein [Vibrio diabolicus]|uniref:phage tail-collar fiber domain-containing protein n=1 Tax=Vibrio diabolicus TaxID=50719 RepID=UPI0022A839CA|nr:phage tail protein [Vibrio diabolicus]MCZ0922619.1 phage tail protein [Vibrio diabolicus]
MSQTVITKAFESYKAQQEAVSQPVILDEFVLANVPGLDPTLPIDREEGIPTEHIVHVTDVHQDGFVNPNAVVYSITLDTRIGDFDFNWIGLRNKATGTLAAITHLPTITKYKSIPGVKNGNAITRSILMSYVGAKSATGITVDASTWQIDFTARLFGIDEAERLANRDHYGPASFFADGFLVYKDAASYKVNAGLAYVEGLRCALAETQTLLVPAGKQFVYVDTSWQGQVTSRWQSQVLVTVSNTELNHYTDDDGFEHFVSKLATIEADGQVVDHRILKPDYAPKDYVQDLVSTKSDKGHAHDDDYYLKHHVDSLIADAKNFSFKATGLQGIYSEGDPVAWKVKSGVYNIPTPSSTELLLQMYSGSGSTPAAQFRFKYKNGGVYYRSARDGYGFEEGWIRLDKHEQFLHLWSSQTEHTLTRNGYSKAYLLVRKYSETRIRIDADSFKNDDEIVICNQIENAGKVTVVLETTRGAKIYAPDNTGHASVTITGRCKATFRVTGSNFYISSVTQ